MTSEKIPQDFLFMSGLKVLKKFLMLPRLKMMYEAELDTGWSGWTG